ncbi:MAG: DNA alkylation repair protein [archaeon]
MGYNEIILQLKSMKNQRNIEGMARFGINSKNTLGISIPFLRETAKKIGKDHLLAFRLWGSNIHEARILAALIDDPKCIEEKQMELWVSDFDSWDICDQTCMNLFDKTPFAYKKAIEWSNRKEEFVKRAAFALMAVLAVHDKSASDDKLLQFLSIIKRESTDERNFVKKAVNWALRQIGKRNANLNRKAIATANDVMKINSKSARWIASDALKELESIAVKSRLKAKS